MLLCFMKKKEKLPHDCTYIGLSHVCIVVQGKVVGLCLPSVKAASLFLERCTIRYQ